MPTYTSSAQIQIEIDLSNASGGSDLANLSLTLKAAKSDGLSWALYPGGYDNSSLPFLVSSDNNANHNATASIPIAQFQISNEMGGDKQMSMTYLPQNSSQGGSDTFYITAYIWGTTFSAQQNTVKMNMEVDGGVTVYVNQSEIQKDGSLSVPVTWVAFPAPSQEANG